MSALQITLRRSPRSLVVGNQTINIEPVRENPVNETISTETASQPGTGSLPAQQDDASVISLAPRTEPLLAPPRDRSASTDHSEGAAASESARHISPTMPTSVASVITDPSTKVVTPLALSNAVPVLSGATHELVTASEVGFGSVSEEELAELKQLLAIAAENVTELQEQHRQSLSEMQEVAVELAAAAASWLVGFAIERDFFAIDDLIAKSLHQLELDQPVRVRLNPADHELLKRLMKDPASRKQLTNVSCFDDPDLPRGGCRVESGRMVLLSDMDSRLDEIRRSWMEKLDDSQVERRGDGSASRTVRRFPDRRETA